MLEFIGTVVVIWVVFKLILKFIIAYKRAERKVEQAEIRRFATEEFCVPIQYYNFVIVNGADALMQNAVALIKRYPEYADFSWQMFYALAIRVTFARDCDLYMSDCEEVVRKFDKLGITMLEANNGMISSVDDYIKENT